MADDYNKALMDELMRAMMADGRGPRQGRPEGVGPAYTDEVEFRQAGKTDPSLPPSVQRAAMVPTTVRKVDAGPHGMIDPAAIGDPSRPPALPMDPAVAKRMEALANARGLVRGGMSKPNELDAARDPAQLSEFLRRMPPEQRMRLIQQLQGLSKAPQ